MSNLDIIWKEMEEHSSPSSPGNIIRRIYPETPFDLFITLEKPSNYRTLQFEVSLDAVSGLTEIPSTRVMISHLEKYLDQGKALLELALVDARYAEVFTILVSDLSVGIIASDTQQKAISHFLARLQHWILFLENSGPDGLRPEAQRGLYGELWFLKNYLLNRLDHFQAVTGWTGADATPQDFQLSGTAVEVKVTTAKLPQNLIIANERQLDDTAVGTLFLLHLSLDARKGSGETLNKIIDDMRNLVKSSAAALQSFELILLKVGYLGIHHSHYDTTGYVVLSHKFFHVIAGFPRIIGTMLPSGVGNVHYSIEVSACVPFTADSQFVISTILKGI